MSIFVQIASYRDPQIVHTIQDMLLNVKNPKKLTICICNQYHPDDTFNLNAFRKDKRFIILDVLYSETKGACWARNQIQKYYAGQDYTLQIDSHMRFIKHWDLQLIDMITNLKYNFEKPMLTSYVSSFNPENDPASRVQEPWQMAFDRFIPEGTVFFLPETIPNWKQLTGPVRSRFYSAHFCFTLGQFCVEVPHDPNLYFHSEEMSITVRAYTHGYDLFHPHRVLIWHEYTRKGRTKHWDDDKEWGKKNEASHRRNRILFGMEEGTIDDYGFGTIRTLADYEAYSGIRFKTRSVQQYTTDKNYPPNPISNEDYEASFVRKFKHCIDIPLDKVPETDYDCWAVAFEKDGKEIYRKDAVKDEIKRVQANGQLWREFQTSEQPNGWVVWPHSISKGWCDRFTGKI
jgi:hypothetical protein